MARNPYKKTPSLRGGTKCRRGNLGKNSKKCYETYYFLDSRLRGNDIRHFFRAMQQCLEV
ncbi:hypothetical protein [Rickettsia endosymbiont of Orchestes rusci]|uniref:hypothetical protein n=1 Tax=Rickettsia endosymbiont of Orchestes rusci TaxID=3066250 RepID=UPI00313A920A